MNPTVSLDRTLVALNVDGVVHLMLELAAPPAPQTVRPPLDVVVVLDRSGSMAGEPLRAVREATCGLLRLAGADDRLGVVAFDQRVDMVLPLARHDANEASRAVRAIHQGGSTNLSGGWLKALEMLTSDVRPNALRRIVLLTDGHANHGVTDIDALSTLMASAKAQSITTSTIGFADGYDERFLAALADAGAGNDYWCAGPDQAAQVFNAEFEGLASVVAQNISVEIRQSDQVSDVAVLNEFPMTVVDGGVQIALGDAYGSEQRRVVAMFQLKAPDTAGVVQVCDLVIRWASIGDDVALHTVTVPVVVNATDDPAAADAGADPKVIEEVNVLRAAQTRKEAHERLSEGDFDGARRLMSDALDTLVRCQASPEFVSEVQADLAVIDQGRWDAASTKRLYAAERARTRGRRSGFEKRA